MIFFLGMHLPGLTALWPVLTPRARTGMVVNRVARIVLSSYSSTGELNDDWKLARLVG